MGMNVKELTHSQQQPKAPNAQKKNPTIRLTTRVTMLWAPKGPFFADSWSWMKSSARNTLSNQQAQETPETVNLTENVPKGQFQRLLPVALRMYLTLHLLLFEHSM